MRIQLKENHQDLYFRYKAFLKTKAVELNDDEQLDNPNLQLYDDAGVISVEWNYPFDPPTEEELRTMSFEIPTPKPSVEQMLEQILTRLENLEKNSLDKRH